VTLPTKKMRRYDIVSGILLILSIIDFALAAPVLVQEKRQASVDVLHTLKDVITVLGKRGDAWLEKFVDDYFKGTKMENSVVSSDAHSSSGAASSGLASSSSAPLGFEHGSTNVVQAPAPNTHLLDEYSKTWTPPILDSSDVHASSSSTPPGTDHGSTNVVQAPASNSAPSIANPNPLIESSGPSATAAMQGS
jgi:hypothetical protein